MRISIGELRSIVRESLVLEMRAKWEAPQGGIILARVGGLSPVVQRNKSAPTRRGVWAFIWPFVEPFLIGSTNAEGRSKPGKSRYDQMKAGTERLRKFVHRGELYTRFDVPGAEETDDGNWKITTSRDLVNFLKMMYHRDVKSDMGEPRKYGHVPKGEELKQSMTANPYRRTSKDAWEVFVPEPDEERVRDLDVRMSLDDEDVV